MDNEININGIQYIRKDSTEQNWLELRKVVNQSINELENVNSIIDIHIDGTEQKAKRVNKDQIKELKSSKVSLNPKLKTFKQAKAENEVKNNIENMFTPQISILYKNIRIDEFGIIRTQGGGLGIHIDHIKKMSKEMETGDIDVVKWSKVIHKHPSTVKRIVYNIYHHIFDEYVNSVRQPVNNTFETLPGQRKIYKIKKMNDKGEFVAANGRILPFTIHHIIELKSRVVGKDIVVDRAKVIAEQLDFNWYTFNRVVYNIEQGRFNKWINKWQRKHQ